MKRWIQRVAVVAFGVLLFNVAWNVAGSIAIVPNSPAPHVTTILRLGELK